jgi:hypothetical protein
MFPPDFSAPRFSRKFSDLETPVYRASLYRTGMAGLAMFDQKNSIGETTPIKIAF